MCGHCQSKRKKDVNKKELIDSQTINREIFHVIATYHVLAQVSKISFPLQLMNEAYISVSSLSLPTGSD